MPILRNLAALSLLLLTAANVGCAGSEEEPEEATEDAIIGGRTVACTQVVNSQLNHVANLEAKNGVLTIKQSSTTGRFAPITHNLQGVMLMSDPGGRTKFACTSGNDLIKVWRDVARVNRSYYRLIAPAEGQR